MPTGLAHDRAVNTVVNGEITQEIFPCRCTIGDDHIEGPTELGPGEDDSDDGFSFSGAEEIYDSSGRDEDYDFR
jgi:hypothetical protein